MYTTTKKRSHRSIQSAYPKKYTKDVSNTMMTAIEEITKKTQNSNHTTRNDNHTNVKPRNNKTTGKKEEEIKQRKLDKNQDKKT